MVMQILGRVIGNGAKFIADHAVSTILIVVLALALVFVSLTKFPGPSSTMAAQSVPTNGPAPVATEQYFDGQRNYDASLIWASLSDQLIQRATAGGATQDDLQSQLDQAREMGRQVDQTSYIGSYQMDDGKSMHFYVATVRSSEADMAPDPIFYVFTLDADGKILNIE